VERQPERLAGAHRRASSEAGLARQIRTARPALGRPPWVRVQVACRVLTQEFLQLLIHLPVAYLLATPTAPKKGGRGVLWPRTRLRERRLLRTPSLPIWFRRVPVQLLRMRRTDSQLALEYYQAATSGPVAHGATPETCGATLTWPAVEFAFLCLLILRVALKVFPRQLPGEGQCPG
jgi:hypothetical protein